MNLKRKSGFYSVINWKKRFSVTSSGILIRKLAPVEKDFILQVAHWYHGEWNTPVDKIVERLTMQPADDVLFQLVLTSGDKLIATGGLCNKVNILNVHPKLGQYGPWVTMLYTHGDYRKKGFGEALLQQLETNACDLGIRKIYLYTFTAEALYKRCGWQAIDRVTYKEHDTVVMEKILQRPEPRLATTF